MLKPPRPARRVAILLATLLAAAAPVLAAPQPPAQAASDPVMNLLRERGLLERGSAAASQFASNASDFASDLASDLVLRAMNFLGVPYKRGGQSAEQGFDCSGFTRHVFESSLGLVLPRRSQEQAKAPGWLSVKREELRPGDLVFFNTLRSAFSHVGIYVGDGKFIHAPRTGGQVRVEDMRAAYWAKRYNGARRAPEGSGAGSVLMPAAAAPFIPPAEIPSTLTSGAAAPLAPATPPLQ
ncbi:C40 family peptidase [Caldimonas sp. KR1-144]|uniref:C40 family peptidase n=1 Tax=Caldimonas sp. KR1-144 TaxID=3400911 RepID=UPI003C0817E5